ncbi:methyltransferase domain-containing protein [Alkalicaulis satelles]|uniref:Methyltransferase domain-containing protein n=1 Tax=Alkalicaulis satelles TaxID=2609175 RepID=A0A5M6ZJG1_9PROT|nr:methyltransferase domain-containing protein [Alkalicaulis satelles]KAA5803388.1 methyltransferase domain-containing protein [Alkalicaulis satelles]
MRTDALEIDRFYRSVRGRAARDMALRRLTALWPQAKGLDVLGYGYAGAYLEPYRDEARRTVAYMPAAQGAVVWPRGEASLTALGAEARLPFGDAMFDRVVLAHALEEADDLRRLLRELWRVTAPEGRIVVIAPHRGGLWARAESTPFGHGRPFSRRQLSDLLTGALFEPVAWSRALYAPPWRWTCGPKLAPALESAGERAAPAFGGLILAEAIKHVGAVHPGGAAQRVRRKVLEGAVRPALSPSQTPPQPSGKDPS